jgi:predicted transcriptional regulator
MKEGGIFCETYGTNARNMILEHLLENQGLDFAIGDIAKQTGISRPKAYEVIREFEKKGFIKKSRVIGKTQLYIMNKADLRVKLFTRDFKECLRFAYEKKNHSSSDPAMAYAKTV